MKKLRDAEVFGHIVLNFAARTGNRVTIAKDFPPEIEKLEARLRQCAAHYDSEVVRDPETGKFVEKRFDLVADFQGSVRVVPDHDSARVVFHIANVDGFETVSVVFPAFEVGTARLDKFARWITGEQHAFLRDGEHVRRVPAWGALRAAGTRRLDFRVRRRRSPVPCRSSGRSTPPTSPTSSPR